MGFDHIDRMFQKRNLVELECVDCGTVKLVAIREPDKVALCPKCLEARENEQRAAYLG